MCVSTKHGNGPKCGSQSMSGDAGRSTTWIHHQTPAISSVGGAYHSDQSRIENATGVQGVANVPSRGGSHSAGVSGAGRW